MYHPKEDLGDLQMNERSLDYLDLRCRIAACCRSSVVLTRKRISIAVKYLGKAMQRNERSQPKPRRRFIVLARHIMGSEQQDGERLRLVTTVLYFNVVKHIDSRTIKRVRCSGRPALLSVPRREARRASPTQRVTEQGLD